MIAGVYHAQTGELPRGGLGTWVRFFYPYFKSQAEVRTALNQLLRGAWTSQNYVGNYFMRFMSRIATAAADRDAFIEGVAKAVADNAWTVKGELKKLPEDWQAAIAELLKPSKPEEVTE